MGEVGKFIGGLVWLAGVILLFTIPPAGVIVLLAAVFLSVRSARLTKEKRHQELLDTARKLQNPPPPEG